MHHRLLIFKTCKHMQERRCVFSSCFKGHILKHQCWYHTCGLLISSFRIEWSVHRSSLKRTAVCAGAAICSQLSTIINPVWNSREITVSKLDYHTLWWRAKPYATNRWCNVKVWEKYLMLNIYWSTKQQNRVGWNNSCVSKEHFSCLNLQLYKQELKIMMSQVREYRDRLKLKEKAKR